MCKGQAKHETHRSEDVKRVVYVPVPGEGEGDSSEMSEVD